MKRAVRAILVADVVEFVRLMETDEEGTIERWLQLTERARQAITTDMQGQIIKTMGDGILVEFGHVRNAVQAAQTLHALASEHNAQVSNDRHILLRIGIDYGNVILQQNDVFGRGVNRAARLMSLANPGETVISDDARVSLTDRLDGQIEDLGNCFLRHQKSPVRAFRIATPSGAPQIPIVKGEDKLRPVVAILPFHRGIGANDDDRTGDVISEEIIRLVSRSAELAVISRMSTSALSARSLTIDEIAGHLNADYVLSGTFNLYNGKVMLDAELAECASGTIIWTQRIEVDIDSILSSDASPCDEIAAGLFAAITLNELSISRRRPLPTLKSYTLLLGAIELMHHLSPNYHQQSRQLLEELVQRSGRQPVPLAWLANWHVLRVVQGWSEDIKQDANAALWNCQIALDTDPECELALAMDGFANLNLLRNFDVAEDRFDAALQSNPSSAIAHMLKGTLYAFSDRGHLAVEQTEQALNLSPLDPHRFIFETHCAGAYLSAQDYEKAAEYAGRSYRSNRRHASTLRILAVSLWELGREREARNVVKELLAIEPDFSRSLYLKRSPNADFKIGRHIADVLHHAGVPA